MQCANCGQQVNRLGYLLRGHVCTKQIPKLGAAFLNAPMEPWGRGTAWMPEAYGEYYAKYPAVYAAVKLRADAMIVPTLTAYRRDNDGNLEELESTHPLAEIISKVNPFWTKGDLLRATSTYLDLWGSAFWILKKAAPGSPPTEIWTLRPDHMHVVPSRDNYIEGYWYQAPVGIRLPFRPDEVVWLRAFNPLDEYAGLSPIAAARLSIDMGREGIMHNRNIFKNGMLWGNVALAAKEGATFSEDQAKEFRESLKERFAKPENSHVPLIMSNFEAKNLGLSNRDMEFMAALRWSLEDVARVFAIPKPMLGDLEKATYENIDAAERIFWRSSMMPHLRFIEEQLNEMLIPQFGDGSLLVQFDTNKIDALQEDANEVSKRQIDEITAGALTINEYREQHGLEAVPWGDVWWAPFTVQPIETPDDAQRPMPAFGAQSPSNGNGQEPPPKRLPVGRVLDAKWKLYEPASLPDSFVAKILALHDRTLTKSEAEFRHLQGVLFDQQRREVIRRVAIQKSVKGFEVKALPHFDLFNLRDWIERYVRQGAPIYAAISTLGAQQQINAFSLPIAFDIRKIQPWLDLRVAFWATRVNEETARLLIQEISEGIGAGESLRKLQDRVERVFSFSDAVRSERIARTETQAALNEGAVESYRQTGVVERKMWLATLDDRTRDIHLEAHRQTVELEANFLVGGEAISHPGEGSPENAINCRCTVAPIITQRSWRPPILGLVNGTKQT